jgi:hypothetical protein
LRFIGDIVTKVIHIVHWSICIYHSSGFVFLIAADNMQIRLTDKQIADAITSLERQSLRDKMAHWGDELK